MASFLLCMLLFFNKAQAQQGATPWQDPLPQAPGIRTVVIDPGHGGHDSGCLGANSQEKHLALAIARKLRDSLQATWPELRVIMTREDDTFIPLNERARIANANKADLFISIHCNFMPGMTATRGTETYVLGTHKLEENLEVAMRENSSILLEDNYEEVYDFDPNSPEGYIIMSMYQNAFLEQSIRFATLVEESLASYAKRRSRGVKQAGFLVLRATAMPSVLIETGFLSYGPEEQYLRSKAGQEQIAGAILWAFAKYKRLLEGSPRPLLENSNTRIEKQDFTSSQPLPPPQDSITTNITETKEEAVVHFRVQLLASPRRENLSTARWQNIGYSIQVIEENGLFKYQAFSFPDLDAARTACKQLREQGFNDAFIVAYRGSQRIPLTEVLR